jgi:ketosteroid isomerase-like protein
MSVRQPAISAAADSALKDENRERRTAVMSHDRLRIARDSYIAFAAGDRSFFEAHLSDRFSFSSPPDPSLDREGWFERCWPGAGRGQQFEFVRLLEAGEEVVVTYELRRADGGGGRNTEILTFDERGQIAKTEVYFGWDLS